ncbi:x-pro dipeptidyl-peptidase (s15 family) [Cystoisospora suis]|uniref:X-pro dipeptidyl-peptidase (S15 family) n=1 Tax=Cystoisospora suis TaxID=483139 RepID=A0A2C6LFR1_9APIC|nr:x-pro dipeptidyl-peptidase (s15 family) [Cystoisospora suis]
MGLSPVSWSWAGVACGLLSFAILFPPDPALRFTSPPFKAPTEPDGYVSWRKAADGKRYGRQTVHIKSGEGELYAWLYLPTEARRRVPIYIICHGLGALMVTGSAPVAEKVQEKGGAALTFDYRMWGFTAGEPRQIIEPGMQLQDLRAVIEHVINTDGFGGLVNPADIHLFGTSYAGGHVLVTAAQFAEENNARLLRSVRSITSVVPLLDGKAQLRKALQQRPFFRALRYLAAILADLLRQAAGHRVQPVYVQVGGSRDDSALPAIELKDTEFDIWKDRAIISSATGSWSNSLAARSLFWTSQYRPIERLPSIRTPTLLVKAENDGTCIPELTDEAVEILNAATGSSDAASEAAPLAELLTLPINHFEVYVPPYLDRIVEACMDFGRRHGGSVPVSDHEPRTAAAA